MLLILEIAMFVGGIYSIVSGKVPAFLLGGGKYQVEGQVARWFGTLFAIPLTGTYLGAFILGFLLGEDGIGYAGVFELVLVFSCVLLSVLLVRVWGGKLEPRSDLEETIARKAQGALMYALFSMTGFAALICCPLAFVYANQAVRLSIQHDIGEQHIKKAKTARAIAAIVILLWFSVVFFLASYWQATV